MSMDNMNEECEQRERQSHSFLHELWNICRLGILVRGKVGKCEVKSGEGYREQDCIEEWRQRFFSLDILLFGALGVEWFPRRGGLGLAIETCRELAVDVAVGLDHCS